jgi:hypothetical protein
MLICRRENLRRAGDVEHLDVRESQQFDAHRPWRTRWRDLWVHWRHRQTIEQYIGPVELDHHGRSGHPSRADSDAAVLEATSPTRRRKETHPWPTKTRLSLSVRSYLMVSTRSI